MYHRGGLVALSKSNNMYKEKICIETWALIDFQQNGINRSFYDAVGLLKSRKRENIKGFVSYPYSFFFF